MIYCIHIKNIALISDTQIIFGDGFNVITGETGAGKSVLIGSINMLLGERADRDVISFGADKAEVSAIFYIKDDELLKVLSQEGIELNESGELVVSRQISKDGRNVCRINGALCNVSMLKNLGRYLVDLHGQHNNQALLDRNEHINILDRFASDSICDMLSKYKDIYGNISEIKRKLAQLEIDDSDKLRRIDILRFEINEINSANLTIGEDDELKKKKEIADNYKKLIQYAGGALDVLYESGQECSAYQGLAMAGDMLLKAAEIDDELKEASDAINEAAISVQEISRNISSYIDRLSSDSEGNTDIDARLDELYKIKRKYGGSIEEALVYLENSERELELINTSEQRRANLEKLLEETVCQALELAKVISGIRKDTAKKIEGQICQSMRFLNMANAEFVVSIKDDEMSKTGCDNVEFLLSTIEGEPPKPLSKIASGGELSRIMLAIKSVLVDTDTVKTLIFDEIDTGVSGRAAQKIGEKIKELSKIKQVFCVTHLAQIAALADRHFVIEKKTNIDRSTAEVSELDEAGRISEISRIIGGDNVSETTIKQAKEMLNI